MKVAFISRTTLFSIRGGDTTQVEQTAIFLRKLNVEVDIKLADELIDYSTYDLIHFFNLIRPADILPHLNHKTPIVVSPIFVDYSNFDQKDRNLHQRIIGQFLGKNGSEYIKCLLRAIRGQDKLLSKAYLLGHAKSIRKVLNATSMLLPNSESEAKRVYNEFPSQAPYKVVPYAINKAVFYQKKKC